MRRSSAPSRMHNSMPSWSSKAPITVNANIKENENPCKSNVLPLLTTIGSESTTDVKCFKVVYGNMSKKKHINFDGDGVLHINGRLVQLYDEFGKSVFKPTSCRLKEVQQLEEGSDFVCHGKKIEIQSRVALEDFLQKRCFQTEAEGSPSSVAVTAQLNNSRWRQLGQSALNPFKPVIANIQRHHSSLSTPKLFQNDENSLIMPRPSANHIFQHNTQQLNVTDVVVDSSLSRLLRPHQRDGVVFLYKCVMGLQQDNHYGAILADSMGLGKTLQSITLIWTLLKQGPYGGLPVVRKVVIVTPGSLVQNWEREFNKWLGSLKIKTFAVTTDNRIEDYLKCPTPPVIIISYEMYIRVYELLNANVSIDLLICDEGHRLKNQLMKTWTTLQSISCRRRILLTGTPVQNDLNELFSLSEFCNPNILVEPSQQLLSQSGQSTSGDQFTLFRRAFVTPITVGRQPEAHEEERQLGIERSSLLSRITSTFVLQRSAEVNVNYLPPKVESIVFCHPTPLQIELLDLLNEQLKTALDQRSSGTLSSLLGVSPLVAIDWCKKICNDPSLLFNKLTTHPDNDPDQSESIITLLLNCFQQSRHSVESGKLLCLGEMLLTILDSSSKEKTLDLLQSLCNGLQILTLRIDGSVPTTHRIPIVEKFNSTQFSHRVMLLSSKAGGVGLNLVGARYLILYDIDWNPANDIQAMARIWRDGQQQSVRIYRLLTTGTIEEKIFQRQITKTGLSKAVECSDSNRKNIRGDFSCPFSKEELLDLFTLHPNTDCHLHASLICQCLDDGGVGNTLATTANVLPNPSDSAEETPRACQLGCTETNSTAGLKNNNSCVSQLTSWNHLLGSKALSQHLKDFLLLPTLDFISCVFWHETWAPAQS